MSPAKNLRISINVEALPPEVIEKILENLKLSEVNQAKLVCKRWKSIIECDSFFNKVSGKINLFLNWVILLT